MNSEHTTETVEQYFTKPIDTSEAQPYWYALMGCKVASEQLEWLIKLKNQIDKLLSHDTIQSIIALRQLENETKPDLIGYVIEGAFPEDNPNPKENKIYCNLFVAFPIEREAEMWAFVETWLKDHWPSGAWLSLTTRRQYVYEVENHRHHHYALYVTKIDRSDDDLSKMVYADAQKKPRTVSKVAQVAREAGK